jgi:hypothetical protein
MAVGIPPEIYWNIMDRYNQFTKTVKQAEHEQDMESVIEKFRKEGLSEDALIDLQRTLIRLQGTGRLINQAMVEALKRHFAKTDPAFKQQLDKQRAFDRQVRQQSNQQLKEMGSRLAKRALPFARHGSALGAGILASTIGQDLIKDYYQDEIDQIQQGGVVTPDTVKQMLRNEMFVRENKYRGSNTPYYVSPMFDKYR